MEFAGPWMRNVGRENNYLYNGKEANREFGLDWLDYGARWYDAALGRFGQIDPLAEIYFYQGGYTYAANDPIGLLMITFYIFKIIYDK